MSRWHRRAGAAATIAAVTFSATSCASGGSAAPGATAPITAAPDDGGDPIRAAKFAESLDVVLSEMTRKPSGLYVKEFDPGNGPPATAGDLLGVRYTLYLVDGSRVGGTAPDEGPFEFRLGNRQVVAGWDEGLTGLRPGGRRRLIIPPKLGYGSRSRGEVPRNAIMIVDLRLVEVRR